MVEFLKLIDFTVPEQNFNLAILAMLVVLMVIFEKHSRTEHRHRSRHSGETT